MTCKNRVPFPSYEFTFTPPSHYSLRSVAVDESNVFCTEVFRLNVSLWGGTKFTTETMHEQPTARGLNPARGEF